MFGPKKGEAEKCVKSEWETGFLNMAVTESGANLVEKVVVEQTLRSRRQAHTEIGKLESGGGVNRVRSVHKMVAEQSECSRQRCTAGAAICGQMLSARALHEQPKISLTPLRKAAPMRAS